MFAGIPIIVKHTKYSDIKHDAAPKAASKLASDYSSRKRGRFVNFIQPRITIECLIFNIKVKVTQWITP